MREYLPARDFAGFRALYARDPWGPERNDLMVAQLCTLVANVARGKGGRRARVSDFMPKFGPPPEPRSGREIFDAFGRSAAALS